MSDLLSSLDGILCLETVVELAEETEDADFDFLDGMFDDDDINFDSEEEEVPYV